MISSRFFSENLQLNSAGLERSDVTHQIYDDASHIYRRIRYECVWLICAAALGAECGWLAFDVRLSIAVLAGTSIGLLVGTLIIAFARFALPDPFLSMTIDQSRITYRRHQQRGLIAATLFAVFFLGTPVVMLRYAREDNAFAFYFCLSWFAVTMLLCIYTKIVGMLLKLWKCPRCAQPFHKVWQECESCGLSLDLTDNSETAERIVP